MSLILSPTRPSRRRAWCWLVALLLLFAPLAASAQTCFIEGAFGMDFGAVTEAGGSATSSIGGTCQTNDPSAPIHYFKVCVYLGPGDQSQGTPTRRMINYANSTYLNYDLFSDPAHTARIGALGSGDPVYSFTMQVGPGQESRTGNLPVYGLVYPDQPAAGSGDFQEQGISHDIYYRYDTTGYPVTDDCVTGGQGGGSSHLNSSGVYATFENSCTITATDLDFGQTVPPAADVTGTSTITVQCPANTSWQIGLGDGLNFGDGSRRMAGAGNFVAYGLYRDAGHAQPWGDTLDSDTYPGSTDATGQAVDVTVYGLVPAQPAAVPGNYSDTVTATLTF